MPFEAIELIPPPDGAAIRESRLQAGITQAAMASALGLSDATRISKLESGAERTSASTWTLWLLLANQHPTHKINNSPPPLARPA